MNVGLINPDRKAGAGDGYQNRANHVCTVDADQRTDKAADKRTEDTQYQVVNPV